jgi:hypothetical protein
MINWVKTNLSDGENSKVRLKVVYDKNGYTKVSNLGIFVEPMSVTESQIKLWKNDLLERPVQPDKEDDPFGGQTMSAGPATSVTADSNTGADDLPF